MRFRSAGELSVADVGRRVTVRRRLADGKLSDSIGLLRTIDDTQITVETRDGIVVIVRADIVASRVIEATKRGRAL